MPGIPSERVFDAVLIRDLCLRLCSVGMLQLPARLSAEGDPSQDMIMDHLTSLVENSPATFLERYGGSLREDELRQFEGLRHNFEVAHWLDQTHASSSATSSGRRPAQQRNRRLAAMQRLHDAGEYFSMESMQERDPELYRSLIGSYLREQEVKREEEEARRDEEDMERERTKAAARLVQAQQQSAVRQTLDKDDDQFSEHETDDEEGEEGYSSAAVGLSMAPMDVEAEPQPSVQPLRGAAILGIKAGGKKPTTIAIKRQIISGAGPSSGGGTDLPPAAPPAGGSNNSNSGGSTRHVMDRLASMSVIGDQKVERTPSVSMGSHRVTAGPQGVRWADLEGTGGGIPRRAEVEQGGIGCSRTHQSSAEITELEVRTQQLIEEMEARFLDGEDLEFVNYADIDADHGLDDHWLEEQGRDAEAAYFDDDTMMADAADVDKQAMTPTRQENQDGMVPGEELEEWERMAEDFRQSASKIAT